MKTVKVSDLSGPALDWAVAKCEGYSGWDSLADQGDGGFLRRDGEPTWAGIYTLTYSSDWSLAGPIIERERMCIDFDIVANYWLSSSRSDARGNLYKGKTPLEAAMRSHVACKLGDTIEIPEELV